LAPEVGFGEAEMAAALPDTPPEDGVDFAGADAPAVDPMALEAGRAASELREGADAALAAAPSFLFRASAAAASPSDCADVDNGARKLKTTPRAKAE
jgi:hypothetical protein